MYLATLFIGKLGLDRLLLAPLSRSNKKLYTCLIFMCLLYGRH